jgi:hypothetical protein
MPLKRLAFETTYLFIYSLSAAKIFIASAEEMKMRIKFWLEVMKEKDHSEDISTVGRTLKWILRKEGEGLWMGFIWLRNRDRCYEYFNKS